MSESKSIPAKKVQSEIFEWVESIVFSLIIVILIFTFAFRIVRVDGSSMFPTLHESDRIILTNMFYTPKPGDIVVTSQNNLLGEPLIKRVIAVGGQTIDINPESGEVTVDGEKIDDEHAYYDPSRSISRGAHQYPLTLENGQVFCMGDNRNNSLDSRSDAVGLINEEEILGRAFLRIFPVDAFGLV